LQNINDGLLLSLKCYFASISDISRTLFEDKPIRSGLDAFRASFSSTCNNRSIARSSTAIDQLAQDNLRYLMLPFLFALQILPVTGLLVSRANASTLRSDLLKLISAVASDNCNFDRVKPLPQGSAC
ncbi:hypothetical protein TOPH_08343, partial [Tolypocladium ophioglossoides CBS 100239]